MNVSLGQFRLVKLGQVSQVRLGQVRLVRLGQARGTKFEGYPFRGRSPLIEQGQLGGQVRGIKFEGEGAKPPLPQIWYPFRGRSPLKEQGQLGSQVRCQFLGYIRLGLTSFSTITRELRVVERNQLYHRDPEKISYQIGQSCFWVKK